MDENSCWVAIPGTSTRRKAGNVVMFQRVVAGDIRKFALCETTSHVLLLVDVRTEQVIGRTNAPGRKEWLKFGNKMLTNFIRENGIEFLKEG